LKLSQDTISQIQSRIEIEEVVSDFVSLKRKGQNLWACCPFHHEKSPSFSVSPAKGIYKCFGCGKAGDALQFVMDVEGLSYMEALRYMAKKYGIEIVEEENFTDDQLQKHNERESLFIVLNHAKDHYHENLYKHPEGKGVGLSYFKERGFDEQTIKKFELGYSLDEWDGFSAQALKKGFHIEILEKAGLVIRKEDSKHYDRFRGRVIFPIHNISGKVVAFGARILKADKKQPKYLNSPETEVYHKSKILYGIHQARQAIRQADNCYLVEGYTDVISLHLAGVANVVASSGTSLTEDQIRLINRYTENVTVLFDGDAAGMKASLRGIDMILEGGMNVKAVVFPDGEDPDSYSRKLGSSAFQKYLHENAQDFITFKTSLYVRDAANDPIKKAQTIKEIVGSIAKVPDPIKRAVYLKQCSGLLDIEESVLITEQNKIQFQKGKEGASNVGFVSEPEILPEVIEVVKPPVNKIDDVIALQERESIRLLINYGLSQIEEEYHLYNYLLQELEDIEFKTPVYKRILEIFKYQLALGKVVDADFLISIGDEEIRKEVIGLMVNRYEISKTWEERFKILVPKETDVLGHLVFTNILRLKFRVIQKLIADNMTEMKNTREEEQQIRLLKIHAELKRSEMEIAKMLGVVVR
jgi:DNA primase